MTGFWANTVKQHARLIDVHARHHYADGCVLVRLGRARIPCNCWEFGQIDVIESRLHAESPVLSQLHAKSVRRVLETFYDMAGSEGVTWHNAQV